MDNDLIESIQTLKQIHEGTCDSEDVSRAKYFVAEAISRGNYTLINLNKLFNELKVLPNQSDVIKIILDFVEKEHRMTDED